MPLFDLVRLAATTDLHSHILLIPFVTIYLVWQQRRALAAIPVGSSWLAASPFLLGLTGIGVHWFLRRHGWQPVPENYLCLVTLSFYCFVLGGGFLFLGSKFMKAVAFPVGFLIFMVPLPTPAIDGLEVFFQHTSAEAANAMFVLAGMPFVRDGLVFRLPGITIQVGQECSGIRSSLVLFITSLLAGHLFLRTPWKKTLLAGAVIPLGIVRNGFRIFTIAMLCVHVDASMINSPIHRRGGPLFFILSLVPFFLLLLYLRRSELGGRDVKLNKERT